MAKGKMENYNIGRKIKTLREMRNMSQTDLACKLGYENPSAISQIESGKKGMSMEKIHAAADFFNVPPAFLLSPEDITIEQFRMMIDLMTIFRKSEKTPNYEGIKSLLKLDAES